MASNKAVKFSQTSLAIVSLFLLIFVSATAVSALNPIVEQSSSNIDSGSAKVAGISTVSSNALPLSLDLITTQNPSFKVNLDSKNTDDNTLGTVTVEADNLIKTTYKQDLVKIYNQNNEVAKAKVEFFIPQELKGKLKVYLEDSRDSLIMYTQDLSYGPKTITLPELGERDFKIRVESLEDINTPIKLVFVFTVGQ